MELVDLSLNSLSTSQDEILSDAVHNQCEIGDDLPSPISTSYSNNVFCNVPSSEPNSPSNEEFLPTYGHKITKNEDECEVSIARGDAYSSSFGAEMMIR